MKTQWLVDLACYWMGVGIGAVCGYVFGVLRR